MSRALRSDLDTQTADSQGVLLQGEVFRPARHAHLASGAQGRQAGAPSGQLPGVQPLQKDVLTRYPFQVLEAPFSQPLTQGGSPTLPPSSPTKHKCPLQLTVLGLLMKIFVFPKASSSEDMLSSPRTFSTPSLPSQVKKAVQGHPRGRASPRFPIPLLRGQKSSGLNRLQSL